MFLRMNLLAAWDLRASRRYIASLIFAVFKYVTNLRKAAIVLATKCKGKIFFFWNNIIFEACHEFEPEPRIILIIALVCARVRSSSMPNHRRCYRRNFCNSLVNSRDRFLPDKSSRTSCYVTPHVNRMIDAALASSTTTVCSSMQWWK